MTPSRVKRVFTISSRIALPFVAVGSDDQIRPENSSRAVASFAGNDRGSAQATRTDRRLPGDRLGHGVRVQSSQIR